jgi:hypothetical protein
MVFSTKDSGETLVGKKLKITIIVVVAVVAIIVIAGLASTPYINRDVNSIAGVSQFVVLKDGSLYKARFSLVDQDNYVSASDANVKFSIRDSSGNDLYSRAFNIGSYDFEEYKLLLTGAPIIAYAWQFNQGDVRGSSDSFKTSYLTVSLPNGKVFDAQTSTT